jgi:hypothetical protein
MTPTTKLRFVERRVQVKTAGYVDVVQVKTLKILQQWWKKRTLENTIPELIKGGAGEWRDVEVVND